MKILVIGNGFLAVPIIENLELEGHQIYVFSRSIKSGISSPQIQGDIFEMDKVEDVLRKGFDVVINTAWITSLGKYQSDVINIKYGDFALKLAKKSSESGVKHFIGFGSCAEYGIRFSPSVAGVTPLSSTNLYSEQKIQAFNSTKDLLMETATRFSWVRIFQPYGLNQDSNRLIPYLINCLKNEKKIEINDQNSILDWVTTRDIASATSWVIKHSLPIELDVGTGCGYTNLEVLKHLEDLLGKCKNLEILGKPSLSRPQAVLGRQSPLLTSGWRPKDSLATGLDWLVSNE